MKYPLPGSRRTAVIAIGDLGRSPRMLNHALELARSGVEVDLIGLDGEPVPAAVAGHPRIRIHRLRAFERLRARRWRFAFATLAAGRQLLLATQLAWVLAIRLRRVEVLLLQNPPAFPALPLVLVHRRWRRSRVVLDWHQTTAAMLELRMRRWGGRSRLAAWLGGVERRLARHADHHLCVSEALREYLAQRWKIDAAVVPDLATERFGPPLAADPRHAGATGGRPAVVVGPSGWSADDDFDLLLEALHDWDALLSRRLERRPVPLARFVLTGRGERRQEVEATLRETSWRHIEVRTAWFSPEEYPSALAGADLGLSLHASAGGLDVPIKLCELLACGVPVLCLDYGPAVRERIRDGVNGRLFCSAAELAALLDELLGGFPDTPSLARLRAGVRAERQESWESAWQRTVLPALAAGPVQGPG
jgi:beta-1,4-mannosyltransferase